MVGENQQFASGNLAIIGKRLAKLGPSERGKYVDRIRAAEAAQRDGNYAKSLKISNKLLEDIPND